MDEVLELCRRVLGDGDLAEEATAVAYSEPTSDRIAQLALAARACRERADAENRAAEPGPASEAPTGLADAVARELASATARLPERHREALALRELLRLSYEQTARVIGIDAAAVGPLLARARLRLRAERRGSLSEPSTSSCAEHDRALRILACRQDSEPLSHEDDEWVLAHLAQCSECEMAHAAMLEASVCYRAWP
jgi:hypothetical protein